MSLRCVITKTSPVNQNRPSFILWEGALAFEDPGRLDANGRPSLLLKVEASLREWQGGSFLAAPQQMEAYIDPATGRAKVRARPWTGAGGTPMLGRNGKPQYTPIYVLGQSLRDMGTKAVQDFLAASRPQARIEEPPEFPEGYRAGDPMPAGDLTKQAQQAFGLGDEPPMPHDDLDPRNAVEDDPFGDLDF